jgi:NAD(P)-dependent dehydrogenase (short-subunit alcohol dehydrogenase family)
MVLVIGGSSGIGLGVVNHFLKMEFLLLNR